MAVLGDYIRIKHGFAFKGDYITSDDNGVVLVTPGNFEIGGGFKEKKCKFFTAEYPKEYVLHAGDLIVTMTDLSKQGDTLGYSALVPKSSRTYLHNQRIGLVDVFNPEADKNYIYWFMRTSKYQKTVVSTASGSTVKHTSPSRIYEIEIDLPPLDEQRCVAALLGTIEQRIQNNDRINDNLEQQAQTIFKAWFVLAALNYRLYDNLEQQAQTIFKAWFIDFEPFGGIQPSDWRISTLSEVSNMGAGGDKPQDVSAVMTDAYPYPIYSNGLSDDGLYGYTNNFKINEESVTVSARGTIGFVCLRHVPYTPIVRLITLIPDTTVVSAKYLYLWLKSIRITGTGTTQQQLTVPDFRKTEIIVPEQTIMSSFTNRVTPLFETIWKNQAENTKLANIRDALLPKLMSGELDVFNIDL